MNRKCVGCGSVLQSEVKENDGYVKREKLEVAEYCERCFKLKFYGEIYIKDNLSPEKIMYDIDQKNTTITYLIDILSINEESIEYLKFFHDKKVYIILTKFDLLPKGVKEGKIVKFFKENFTNKYEVMCVSSKTKYNIDSYLSVFKKDNVKLTHIVGLTNSGKSSFINALLESVGEVPKITVSSIKNTTTDYLEFKIKGTNVVDTPGINMNNSIYNFIKESDIKTVVPKNKIKVKTFQILGGYSIIVENILRIDYEGTINSINFYMNEFMNYKKIKTKNSEQLKHLPNKYFEIEGKKDIVISGLGFIKINRPGSIKVYSLDENLISIRNKMI